MTGRSVRGLAFAVLEFGVWEGRPLCRPIFLLLTRNEEKSDGTEAVPP
jgi:hypothetical protein